MKKSTRFTAVHGMKKYRTSSRKFSKLSRNDEEAPQATTNDSSAVSPIITRRTVSVGRIFLNESAALIRVSEPPYMFKAVTESRPSAEKMRTTAPKPPKKWSPEDFRDSMVSKFSPAHAASAEPMNMIQAAPRADPPYVQRNVLRIVTSGGR